jgi:hypothetical protein
MPSKTVKKGCMYKFVQGDKKGKRCNAPCRGSYCKHHKESTIQKKAEYRQKIKETKNIDKLAKYENIKTIEDLPNLQRMRLKIMSLNDEINQIKDKLFAIRISEGAKQEDIFHERTYRRYGKCKCSDNEYIELDELITSDMIEEELLDIKTRTTFHADKKKEQVIDDKQVKLSIINGIKCTHCYLYDLEKLNNNCCKYCFNYHKALMINNIKLPTNIKTYKDQLISKYNLKLTRKIEKLKTLSYLEKLELELTKNQ